MLFIVLFLSSLFPGNTFGNAIITAGSESQCAREGDTVKLECSYNVSAYSLQWYRQYLGQSPEFIVLVLETGGEGSYAEFAKQRFSASADKVKKHVSLSILQTEIEDTAVYYCALNPNAGGGNKFIFGNGTRLIVNPKEKSKTAAFVLGSDKDNKEEKARACLITDFSSHNISVHFGGVDVPVVPSVIKGDKQYSVVAFLPESKDRSNFNCNAFVNGNTTEGDNNDIENVCESDVAYVFESDEKLNSLSLMVLGLRVIFLKSIVFNVLMTVRAWMS